MKNVEVSAAIIIDSNEKILLTRRGYGEQKGMWEFPGGKLEQGETPEEAIIREIKEELDVDITVSKYLCKVEHDYPSFHLTIHVLVCHLVDALHLKLLEHEAMAIISINEIDNFDLLPADKKVIAFLKSYLAHVA